VESDGIKGRTENTFLEEQLDRLRRLSERVAKMLSELTETSEIVARAHTGPLAGVGDYRVAQSSDFRDRAADRGLARSSVGTDVDDAPKGSTPATTVAQTAKRAGVRRKRR
jgi:hypothetical protein